MPAVLPYVNEAPAGGVGQSAFCDLQSIQVLNGPQGTVFERNAAGGAVLFTTAKPTEDRTGYGIARFGNVGAVDLEGAGSGAIIPDKLLLRVAGTYNSQNGYQHNLYYDNELGGFQREGKKLGEMSHPPQTPRHLLCLGLKRRFRGSRGWAGNALTPDVAPAPAPERRRGSLPEGRNSPGEFPPALLAAGKPFVELLQLLRQSRPPSPAGLPQRLLGRIDFVESQ